MTRPVPADARKGHAATTPTIARSHNPPPMPDPPSGLSDVAVRYWTEIWTTGAGVYKATDHYIISRYCELQSRRRNLLDLVEVQGTMVIGSAGQPTTHPALRMVSDIEGKLSTLEDRLGLNPEARLRLGITAVEHQSRLDAFLEGGAA